MNRIEKISREVGRQERYLKNIYNRKNLKLRQTLELGEEVLILSESIKNKDSPGKFYKPSTDNRPYFNKDIIFPIESRRNIEKKYSYWLKSTKTGKKILKTGSRDKNYTHYLVILFNFLNDISKKLKKKIPYKKKLPIKNKLAYQKKFV